MSGSDLCCFGANNNTTHLYYLGDTGNVHLAWESFISAWSFSDLTKRIHGADRATPGSALACFGYQGQDTRVHFLNSRSEVCQIAFEGDQWVFHNLTQYAKAVPAAQGSSLACFGYQDKDTRVHFLDSEGNVCQIAFEGNQWVFHNLTHDAASADPKQPVTPAATVTPAARKARSLVSGCRDSTPAFILSTTTGACAKSHPSKITITRGYLPT